MKITLINLPDSVDKSESDEMFTYLDGNGCDLAEFGDKSFHLSHSNSVIEHVGSWENKKRFASESQRVALRQYIQTPNYWFPIEPHFMTPFFHWLPENIRVKLLMNFNLGWYTKTDSKEEAQKFVDGCALLTAKEMKTLFPKGKLTIEKIGGLSKSLIVS